MTDEVDVADIVIIGAGVVGLAVGAELSQRRSVVVLERHEGYGRETSSHNSGVVHAGIYYPPDWLKTTLCIEGNRLLYEYAKRHSVRAKRMGKLIIAIDESEVLALELLLAAARENGVPELELLAQRQVASLEPDVRAVAAIFSGTSGVIDQMELMRSLATAAQASGALIAYKHTVEQIERDGDRFLLGVSDPEGGTTRLATSVLVNSAGLGAGAIAAMLGYGLDGDDSTPRLRQVINKGRYYDIVGSQQAARIRHLVYPLPNPDRSRLGVHVTLDIDGGAHIGPDTEWLDGAAMLDYRADDSRRQQFLESAQRYLPWLTSDDIAPGQVGYRGKLSGPGEPPADFLVWHDRGYVHLGGIESPGMTAALAIARLVQSQIEG